MIIGGQRHSSVVCCYTKTEIFECVCLRFDGCLWHIMCMAAGQYVDILMHTWGEDIWLSTELLNYSLDKCGFLVV